MTRRIFIASVLAVAMAGLAATLWAATNETVEVTAKLEDNPQLNPSDVEGRFQENPTGYKDEIHVTNENVTGEGAGVYNDPIKDGARLTITQGSGQVKVDVEGREGIGAMYWVTVVPGGGGGSAGGEETVLWADVEDLHAPGALVLKDNNTGAGKSDKTDAIGDTPTLYCAAPLAAGTANVEIRLNATSGTYDWEIRDGQQELLSSGVLSSGNSYVATQTGILPGTYFVVVTSRNDPNFLRVIDFSPIEIGQYLPASYPEGEIPAYTVSENNPYSYSDGGGQVRSITVSAPIDGDEGASNPYSYGTNYAITINPDNGTATVELNLPGVYMLRIVRQHGDVLVETFQTLAYHAESLVLSPSEWPVVLILTPHWDYNLILDDPADVGLTFASNSITVNPKARFDRWNGVPATSVESLVHAKYVANGNQPLDLAIVSHGHSGTVMGDVLLNRWNAAGTLGNRITGKVKRIRFYACKVGSGADAGPFLQNLKNSANATQTSAYASWVGCTNWPYFWFAGKWGHKTSR